MKSSQKIFGTMAASALVALFLFSAPATARASVITLNPGDSISLATVIDGANSVQIGDKQFGDFFFSYIDNNLNNADNLTRSNVVITALANDYGFGVSFQQPLLAIGNDFKDIVFKYSAMVTDPNFAISDIHLSITGSAGNGGLGTVGEDAFLGGFGATKVGTLQASIPAASGDVALANIVPPVPYLVKLWVQKDVIVAGGGAANGFASITVIDQTFSQIPEPSTALLVGLGLLGMIALKNSKRKS